MQATCRLLLSVLVSVALRVHCLKAPSSLRGEARADDIVGNVNNWTIVPDYNVTFNSMYCCHDHANVGNVLISLNALQFCFSGIFLVVDAPHDGSIDKETEDLIQIAKRTAGEAAELISQHCIGAAKPVARVHVMDYAKKGGDVAILQKAISQGESCDLKQSLLDQAYKNTWPYLVSLLQSGTQYIFHTDADVILTRMETEAVGEAHSRTSSFMFASLKLLKNDPHIVAATPAPPTEGKCMPIERDNGQANYHYHPNCAWFDAEAFLVDTFKLGQFYPLVDPCHAQGGTPMESLLAQNLQNSGVHQVLFDVGVADVEYNVGLAIESGIGA